MTTLHTTVYGPEADAAPTVLALHGLTGHGSRWASLAEEHLPDVRIVAPDLLGHGRSPWTPPWTYEANLDALEQVVDDYIPESARPFVIVGHSFGGGMAVRLAQRLGSSVAGLLLLDPGQGVNPEMALQVVTAGLEHWGYADADAARDGKRAEGWSEVPDRLLDKEIEEHLVDLPDGRVAWRVCAPAAATAWSELARPFEVPPAGLPTTVIVAGRVQPPLVGADFRAACPDSVEFIEADCGHMVPLLEPELCARSIKSLIESPSGA